MRRASRCTGGIGAVDQGSYSRQSSGSQVKLSESVRQCGCHQEVRRTYFEGHDFTIFLHIVKGLCTFFSGETSTHDPPNGYRLLSYRMALLGFDTEASLAGVRVKNVENNYLCAHESHIATMCKVGHGDREGKPDNEIKATFQRSRGSPCGVVSDCEMGMRLVTQDAVNVGWCRDEHALLFMGVSQDGKPSNIVYRLYRAQRVGMHVQEMMSHRAELTMFEIGTGSHP